jgi:hypothetical protein
MSFRPKQIAVVLCLVTSLLVGSASACLCSHHQPRAESDESSCHSGHESQAQNSNGGSTGDVLDDTCVCFVTHPTRGAATKSGSEKAKAEKNLPGATSLGPPSDLTLLVSHPPNFDIRRESYVNIFESLKPSRAPPRL